MTSVTYKYSKKYASRYFQLKVGHGAVGTYLAMAWSGGTIGCAPIYGYQVQKMESPGLVSN